MAFNCVNSAEPRDDFWEPWALLNIKDDTLRHFLIYYRLNIISPDMMDDKEFLKFSTMCGFALNVIKYELDEDGLASSIEKSFSNTILDDKTEQFLSTVTDIEVLREELNKNKEVNMVSNVFHRLRQKMMVLGTIDTLKKLGKSDEYIVVFIAENYQVTPDYVRDLMKVWPHPLLKGTKAQAPSVPAES